MYSFLLLNSHITLFVSDFEVLPSDTVDKFVDQATVSLKIVSRKRRRKCTLKSYNRFTNS